MCISSFTERIDASKVSKILLYTFLLPLPSSQENGTEAQGRLSVTWAER